MIEAPPGRDELPLIRWWGYFGRGARLLNGLRRAANFLVAVLVFRTKGAPSHGLALGHGSDFASSC